MLGVGVELEVLSQGVGLLDDQLAAAVGGHEELDHDDPGPPDAWAVADLGCSASTRDVLQPGPQGFAIRFEGLRRIGVVDVGRRNGGPGDHAADDDVADLLEGHLLPANALL
ncbi:hypothetical protein D9M68_903670 [compost metagenome]